MGSREASRTEQMIIRNLGLEALYKALGPLGMVRFLQQYKAGTGDYTKEICGQKVSTLNLFPLNFVSTSTLCL